MNFSSLILLLLLAGFATVSKAVESTPSVGRKLGRTNLDSVDARSIPFPRVYSAVVPSPFQDPPGGDHISFAVEVDFLGILEVRDKSVKISFMVHDSEELAYFESLIKQEQAAQDLQIQHALTDELQHQINYSDNGFSTRQTSPYSKIDGFSCYKNLAGTFEWMTDMVVKGNFIPDLTVTLTDIGDSYLKTQDENDGYDIMAMKITGTGTSSSTTEKSVFFSMSGIHAREYAPPELASRWAETLIDAYGNDADITAMLDHTEIHLVFQSNPDGRNIAETNKVAMRRKNVNPNGNSFLCGNRYGVDLNRNFPFAWGFGSGSSANKCSDTYRGSAPASEPEVKAIVDYVSTLFPEGQRKADPEVDKQVPFDEATTMGIFFDIHAYGEIVIWPWGHENLESGNDSGFEALANKYRHFNGYENSGPLDGYLYAASGTTDDWAYGALGAASMTFELGTSFYQDCDYFEASILEGNIKALTYSAKTAKAPYSLSKGPDVTSLSVTEDGDSITVNVAVSDSAWSASNHASAQQGVSQVRLFVNNHPDDTSVVGDEVSGGSSTVDISGLATGRHMVYIQATDGAGYKGPITAAYFNKGGGGLVPSPVNSPVATPTLGPTGGTDPVSAPVNVPSRGPTGSDPVASPIGTPTRGPIGGSDPVASPVGSPTNGPTVGSNPVASPVGSPSRGPTGGSEPVASPVGTPTRGPTGGSDPVASPVGSPTRGPTGGSNPVTSPVGFPTRGPTDSDPVASPVGSPTRGPTGSSGPVASPVASSLTRSPTGGSLVGSPERCADTTNIFPILVMDLEKDCNWLAINMARFSFLCQYVEAASACPLTCQKCGLFD